MNKQITLWVQLSKGGWTPIGFFDSEYDAHADALLSLKKEGNECKYRKSDGEYLKLKSDTYFIIEVKTGIIQ